MLNSQLETPKSPWLGSAEHNGRKRMKQSAVQIIKGNPEFILGIS
jgi:hypothetical protein